MGNTCRGVTRDKTRNDSLIKIKTHNDNCYYKPRVNTSSLLCFDPEKKQFREEVLDIRSSFRKGCMFTKLGPGLYILIGGHDSSESWIIHLNEKKMTSLPASPHCLSYGQLNKYKDRIYVTGALITEGPGNKRPAAPYYFDLKLKKWGELPKLPFDVALSGSYIVHTFLYLIGGFLDYPLSPRFFDSFLIYDIPADCWVESMIKTPLQVALPSCITLPNSAILIIGGYDPMGLIEIENTKVLLFDGKNFENCSDLPSQGNLRFSHNGFNLRSEIFLFSDDDFLFIYKVENDEWTFQHKLFWEVFVKDCKINDEEVTSEDWEKIKKLDNTHLHSALKNFINTLLDFKEKVKNSELTELVTRLQQFEKIISKQEVDIRAHIAKHFQLRLEIESYKNCIEELTKDLQASKQEVKKLKEKLQSQEKFLEKVKEKIESKKKLSSSRKLHLDTELDLKQKSRSITERSRSSTNLVKVPVILSSSKSRLSRGRSHSSLSKPLKVQIQ